MSMKGNSDKSKIMFSVIIPAFNAEKFIKKAIYSVLGQSYDGFELIVVDDGSGDGTGDLVKNICDDRITYFRQTNQGVSVARNTGIQLAKHDYICFLDSDDFWMHDHLETMKYLIEKYRNCRMYLTGYSVCLRDGRVVPKSEKLLKSINSNDFECGNAFLIRQKYGYFMHINSICCHREVFSRLGYFEPGVRNGEDDDMWYRAFAYYSVAISKKTTSVYTRTNCGATSRRKFYSDWVFIKRIPSIIDDPAVQQDRKDSLLQIAELRKLSQVRSMISEGWKKKAFEMFRKLDIRRLPKKKWCITLVSFLIPSGIISRLLSYRDKSYYANN